jgi:hypothetical protein
VFYKFIFVKETGKELLYPKCGKGVLGGTKVPPKKEGLKGNLGSLLKIDLNKVNIVRNIQP